MHFELCHSCSKRVKYPIGPLSPNSDPATTNFRLQPYCHSVSWVDSYSEPTTNRTVLQFLTVPCSYLTDKAPVNMHEALLQVPQYLAGLPKIANVPHCRSTTTYSHLNPFTPKGRLFSSLGSSEEPIIFCLPFTFSSFSWWSLEESSRCATTTRTTI